MIPCQASTGNWLVIRCPAGDCATIAERERGTGAIPVFDDLHQVAPLARSKAIRPPVIKDQQVRFRNSRG